MKVEGQCHCCAIANEAEVEPATMGICHCLDCQQPTGAPFFRANIPALISFHILKWQPRQCIKTGDRGARRGHAFGDVRGSPVYPCAPENTAIAHKS
jgi:hypothetical protein